MDQENEGSKKRVEEARRELKSGLTWRSYLAVIYAVVVFQPGLCYLYLVTGSLFTFAMVQWTSLILFAELAKLSGGSLTKQEAGIIFLITGMSTSFLAFLNLIYSAYLRNSPIVALLNLTEEIPSFYAPSSPVPWELRTFFHPSWILPVTVGLIAFMCGTLGGISLGSLTRQMFVEVEKLPFPLQQPPAQAAILFSEKREKSKMDVFAVTALISMIYGVVTYSLPMVLEVIGRYFRVVPIPWVDLNYFIHPVLPGASFGIATDVGLLAIGFIVSFNTSISLFIGSVIISLVGNWFLVSQGLTQFAKEWVPNMSISLTFQRSILYAWIGPIIGVGLAAGLMPLVRHPKALIGTFKSIVASRKNGALIPRWVFIAPFLCATIISVTMFHLLVPEFQIWILLMLSLGWSFIYVLMSTRSVGMTGLAIDIPSVPQLTYLASGYKGYDIWFAPLYVETASGSGITWCTHFKVADLLDIHPVSLLKMFLAALPLALFFGFIYISSFWSLAPIPSATYPGVRWLWPVTVTGSMIWVTRPPQVFRPDLIAGGFITTSILYLVCDFLNLPLSIISLAVGLSSPLPITFTVFLGGIISKLIVKIFGKGWWEEHKVVAAGGLVLGVGLPVVVSSAIVMIMRSMWYRPY